MPRAEWGPFSTVGTAAIGILAQSIGGGVANAGANVAFAGPSTASDGGAVEVMVAGMLTTTGTNATSVGSVGTNGGGLLGNRSLADGIANRVVNLSSRTLYTGASLDLGGAQNVLRNEGMLSWGATSLGATMIDGSLTQTPTGRLLVRTDQISLETAYETIGGGAASLVSQSLINANSAAIASVTDQMDQWQPAGPMVNRRAGRRSLRARASASLEIGKPDYRPFLAAATIDDPIIIRMMIG